MNKEILTLSVDPDKKKENTTSDFQKGNSVLLTFISYNYDVLYVRLCH